MPCNRWIPNDIGSARNDNHGHPVACIFALSLLIAGPLYNSVVRYRPALLHIHTSLDSPAFLMNVRIMNELHVYLPHCVLGMGCVCGGGALCVCGE